MKKLLLAGIAALLMATSAAFCSHRAVDTGKFFCFDEDKWYPAIEEAIS